MNQKNILSTIILSIMLASVVVIAPTIIADCTEQAHAVKGTLYIGEDIANPYIEIKIIFYDGEEIVGENSSNTFIYDGEFNFNIGFKGHEGEIGHFLVYGIYPDGDPTVSIECNTDFYYIGNMTINTSNIPNEFPVANAGGPYAGLIDTEITFDGSGSYDADGTVVGYKWDFDGDGNYDTNWLSTPTTTHTYSVADEYTVELMVKDDGDATDTDTATATITEPAGDDDDGGGGTGGTGGTGTTNHNPIAVASASETSESVGISITFNGSQSSDPDGDSLTFSWEFGDGNTSSDEITTHAYAAEGIYAVTLTVNDGNGGEGEDTLDVDIRGKANKPPTTPTVNGNQTGTKNTEYSYTAVSTDEDGDTIKYTFNWGDGETMTTEFMASGTTTAPQNHTWTTAGIYTIRVTANDNKTDSGTTEYEVLIDAVNVDGIGYMTDDDADGTYDKFHTAGVETNVEKQDDGTYLLDDDGDDSWDYVYDIETNTLTEYSAEPTTEPDNTALIVLAISVILFLIILGYLVKRSNDKKKAQKKAAEKKSQPKKKATSKKSKK
jgi:PKD repeat protein